METNVRAAALAVAVTLVIIGAAALWIRIDYQRWMSRRAQPKAPLPLPRMERSEFLSERLRMVEARQRSQGRAEQLLTGGAAGALVLSITFIENIASSPEQSTYWLLLVAWGALVMSLALGLERVSE